MFKPNPLANSIHSHLRQTVPHSRWSYILIAIALVAAVPPFIRPFDSRDGTLVQVMAAVILTIYWLIQFSVMRSAVQVTRYDWQADAPDALMGTLSRYDVIVARIRAILRHHRLHLMLISLTLLGLCLAVMGFMYYQLGPLWAGDTILKHIIGTVIYRYAPEYPIVPGLIFTIISASVLLFQTFINSILSISYGLTVGRVRRAVFVRIALLTVLLALFLSLLPIIDAISSCTGWEYAPSIGYRYRCSENIVQHRILVSTQGILLSFIDGGTTNMASIFCPGGAPDESYYDEEAGEQRWRILPTYFGTHLGWLPFQIRRLLVAGVTVLAQLALAGLLLRRGGFSKRKQSEID